MAAKKATVEEVQIPEPNFQNFRVTILGRTPIIYHKWSEKAKREIRERQMKKAKSGREERKPVQEYTHSIYLNREGQVAIRGTWVKEALVGAARNVPGLPMTLVRGAVFVNNDIDDLIPVYVQDKKGKEVALVPTRDKKEPKLFDVVFYETEEAPEGYFGYDPKFPDHLVMREDMVRVGNGAADLRYRAQVNEWIAHLDLEFNADVFSASQVVNLLNISGFACGFGEQRPSKGGNFGKFEVKK